MSAREDLGQQHKEITDLIEDRFNFRRTGHVSEHRDEIADMLLSAGWRRGPQQVTREQWDDELLRRCGFVEGAEEHASGSFSNDLAQERFAAVQRFIDVAAQSAFPSALSGAAVAEARRQGYSPVTVEGDDDGQ